jgi:hypothetical protein
MVALSERASNDLLQRTSIKGSRSSLPRLIDQRGIVDELGVTRAAAEKIMCLIPKVHVAGLRKVYVKREDVARVLEEGTRR